MLVEFRCLGQLKQTSAANTDTLRELKHVINITVKHLQCGHGQTCTH